MLLPYEVEPGDNGTSYRFTTSSGVSYVAYFTEFVIIEDNHNEIIINSFGFTCDQQDIRRHDARTRQTIIQIIQDFFNAQPDNTLLYICVSADGQARNRHITFGRWFRESNHDLEKYNFSYHDKNTCFYSSIILKSNNPQKQRLINAFYFTNRYWSM